MNLHTTMLNICLKIDKLTLIKKTYDNLPKGQIFCWLKSSCVQIIGRFMRGMYIACTEELMFEIAKKGQKNGPDVQMKEL